MFRSLVLPSMPLVVLLLSLLSVTETPVTAWERPNIVFIMVDDLGYADLGCYGSQAIQTPRIDRLAREGMSFSQFYSGCAVCAPARSTLMTGRHMGHSSVRGNTGGIPLPASEITVAELLQRLGYVTGGFGKWGLGDLGTEGVPEKQGFDTFFGYYHQVHAHDYYPAYLVENSRKIPLLGNEGEPKQTYSQYVIVNRALEFIRQNQNGPFFCYLPWTVPHVPLQVPLHDPSHDLYEAKPWRKQMKEYAAMCSMMDRQVGQILDLLEMLQITEQTVVFFCSDNGAAIRFENSLDSCGRLRGHKKELYEGGIRVPLLVRWPGKIAPQATSTWLGYFPDILPTLADLVGVPAHWLPCHDGISLVPTLLDRGIQVQHEGLYWEYQQFNWKEQTEVPGGLLQAARQGRWKLVRSGQDCPWELYDLEQDSGESSDLSATYPGIVSKLETWLLSQRKSPVEQVEPDKPAGCKYR